MKAILRYFGFISLRDLKICAERYNYIQVQEASKIYSEDENKAIRYFDRGEGAEDFIEQLINEKL